MDHRQNWDGICKTYINIVDWSGGWATPLGSAI